MRVITPESLRAERAQGERREQIPYSFSGETRFVEKHVVNGEMDSFEFSRPVGELLTTPAGLDSIVMRTILDLEIGREAVPTMYEPIYRIIEDPNFTLNVNIGGILSAARVIFLEHLELEEVKFGARVFGARDSVPIITYAAGFQWTEDMVLYDQTWEAAESARSMGEAYNALMNHLHLSPIFNYTYPSTAVTSWQTATGNTRVLNIRLTLRQAMVDINNNPIFDAIGNRIGVLQPRIMLSHPANRWDIEEALQALVVGGTQYPALQTGIDTFIYYPGYSVQVGERTYTYAGVPTNKIYLIEPARWCRSLVKHGLRVDADGSDLKRLIENAIVGRCRLGVYAALAYMVHEVDIV
jgi:hypothetical protein